jgi:HYR domain
MRRPRTASVTAAAAAAALAVALALAGTAGGSRRAVGTLQLQAQFHTAWNSIACPPQTSPSNGCFRFSGDAIVPGLGRATVAYTVLDDEPARGCHHFDFTPVVVGVDGKGQIDATLVDPKTKCLVAPNPFGTFAATFTGGSGTYADASGSGVVQIQITGSDRGTSIDTWSGTLIVPALDFDVTPPVLRGAASKTVRAPKGAKRVRVRYTVTAEDVVDGTVPATCTPRSASFFKAGRTKVTCSATDSSGNTGRVRFTVTVRRSLK